MLKYPGCEAIWVSYDLHKESGLPYPTGRITFKYERGWEFSAHGAVKEMNGKLVKNGAKGFNVSVNWAPEDMYVPQGRPELRDHTSPCWVRMGPEVYWSSVHHAIALMHGDSISAAPVDNHYNYHNNDFFI